MVFFSLDRSPIRLLVAVKKLYDGDFYYYDVESWVNIDLLNSLTFTAFSCPELFKLNPLLFSIFTISFSHVYFGIRLGLVPVVFAFHILHVNLILFVWLNHYNLPSSI